MTDWPAYLWVVVETFFFVFYLSFVVSWGNETTSNNFLYLILVLPHCVKALKFCEFPLNSHRIGEKIVGSKSIVFMVNRITYEVVT